MFLFEFTFFSISFFWAKLIVTHLVNNINCPFTCMRFTGLGTFEGSLQTNLVFVSNFRGS